MVTPSSDAWHRSGAILAEMALREGLEVARVSKSFANDVLLALSCREAGCILVTDNARYFSLKTSNHPHATADPEGS